MAGLEAAVGFEGGEEEEDDGGIFVGEGKSLAGFTSA